MFFSTDLNTIPPRPTIDAFRLMKDASEEKAEVEKILKEAKSDLANPSLESPKSFIFTEDNDGTKKKVITRRTFKKEEKEDILRWRPENEKALCSWVQKNALIPNLPTLWHDSGSRLQRYANYYLSYI